MFGKKNDDLEDQYDPAAITEADSRFRWLPAAVVTSAFAGFAVLAWHAYHYGAQTADDGSLMVVEADQTPMKEKPLDPGGMKFPNQDKTVFETFAGGAAVPPKVERIMPPPEEPLPKNMETSQTKTWVNDRLKEPKPPESQPETKDQLQVAAGQMIAAQPAGSSVPVRLASEIMPEPQMVDTQTKKAEIAVADQSITPAGEPQKNSEKTGMPKEKIQPQPVKEVSKKREETPSQPTKPTPVKTETRRDTGGSQRVQLGAYGSEAEAKAAWSKMQAKFPELKGKTVYVVKADLGAKGIFYRLRAGGFGDAKAFCAGLSAKGQACMMVR